MIKQIKKLFSFELKKHKKFILLWTLIMFFIIFFYMFLFDTVSEIANLEMDFLPKEMLELVNMSELTALGTFGGYFNSLFSMFIIIIAVFSVILSANSIKKEEANKSIEYLNSFPISRFQIYFSKLLLGLFGTITVLFFSYLATIFAGFLQGGETFDIKEITCSFLIFSISPIIFTLLAVSIAGIFTKTSSTMISIAILLASYMIGYLGSLLGEKGEFMQFFSPFRLFGPTQNDILVPLLAYILFIISLSIIGAFVYKKRDLKI